MRTNETFENAGEAIFSPEAISILESFKGKIVDGNPTPAPGGQVTIEPSLFAICLSDAGASYDAALDVQQNPQAASAPAIAALTNAEHNRAISWPDAPPPAHLDSGQKAAIEAIAKGQNVRIFGPPGCGKSEVITQAVIMALKAGKSVLVGANVPSALAVIERRLAKTGVDIQATDSLVIANIEKLLRLDPRRPLFDLVLIDEATRMSVSESALYASRARQIVVCGDPKQMRPEQDRPDLYTLTNTRNFIEQALTRHYRSQDNKLIFFSNAMNYDMQLRTMPTPHIGRRSGVDLIFVKNATAQSSVYGRTNALEANSVANAIIERIKNFPSSSVASVAMTRSQSRLITSIVEKKLANSGLKNSFLSLIQEEPFWCRTPDEAQGEERDYIAVSATFAPLNESLDDCLGTFEHEHPLNKLNVAMSRARQRCELFVSFLPRHVIAQNKKSQGSTALLALFHSYAMLTRAGDDLEVSKIPQFLVIAHPRRF